MPLLLAMHCGGKLRSRGNLFWNWWKKSDPRNSPWLKIPGRGMETSSRTFICHSPLREKQFLIAHFFPRKSETRQFFSFKNICQVGRNVRKVWLEEREKGRRRNALCQKLFVLSSFFSATFCTFPVNQANNDGNTIYIRNNKFGRVKASQDPPW